MNNKRKLWSITAMVIFFLMLIWIGSMPIRKNVSLRSLKKEVDSISLPADIEKISLKSGIGDSGGNGDYSTLRVVLAVKTDLNKHELKGAIESMNLRFLKHYKNSGNTPKFYVAECKNSRFESPRQFELDFDELKGISDYKNYYFIEFVE